MSTGLNRFKAILCDVDGCLIAGDTVLPGAYELISRFGDRLIAVSNNSTDTPDTLQVRLAALGLPIPAERIVLAGATAIDEIAVAFPGAKLALFGSPTLASHALSKGLVLVESDADFALLTRDVGFRYERLEQLLRLVRAGTALVVANVDATHPAADGGLIPETGALLSAVRTCLPDLQFRVIGKPEVALFRIALRKAGVEVCDAILIGDNPTTDGEGARRLGMAFAAIGNGAARDIADLIQKSDQTSRSDDAALF
jgi:HAD superfamily hydrolase (TIGR01450 family)